MGGETRTGAHSSTHGGGRRRSLNPRSPSPPRGGGGSGAYGYPSGLRLSPLSFFTEGGFRSAGADPRHLIFFVLGRGWQPP